MRDWLEERFKKDLQEGTSGLQRRFGEVVAISQYSIETLLDPKKLSSEIIFDEKENYHGFLDFGYRALLTSLLAFAVFFTISEFILFLVGDDSGGGGGGSAPSWIVNILLAFFVVFFALAGYVGLWLGLKIWGAREANTPKRLFHVWVALAGPLMIVNYVVGLVVLFVGLFFAAGGQNWLYDLFSFIVGLVWWWGLCTIMFDKFGYRWYETVVSMLIGSFGVGFVFGILLYILISPFA